MDESRMLHWTRTWKRFNDYFIIVEHHFRKRYSSELLILLISEFAKQKELPKFVSALRYV